MVAKQRWVKRKDEAVTFCTGLQSCWPIVIYSDESSFTMFSISGRVYAYSTCLNPTVRGWLGCACCCGLVLLTWFCSICPLTELHHCNSTQSSTDYLNFHPDLSGLFQDDPAPIHKGTLNVLMSIKVMSVICLCLHNQHISTPINTYIVDFGAWCWQSSSHQLREYLLGKMVFLQHSFRNSASVSDCWRWPKTLLTFVGFSFNLSVYSEF